MIHRNFLSHQPAFPPRPTAGVLWALITLAVGALLSWLLVGAVRRYALQRALLDQPTARSSHLVPTPRGGGLGLVSAVLLTLIVSPGSHSNLPLQLAFAGVVLTAAVGWLDDHRSLGIGPRLVAHGLAGLTLLPLALWPTAVPAWLGVFAAFWWVFWAMSAINVVNFMDGVDALIGSQALVFGVHLAWRGAFDGSAAVLGLALAGAAAGFLVWNWPPSRIFLGDVGSGALGLLFVLGGILLLREGQSSFVVAYLPLYPIFLDATVTLARRLLRGARVGEAHRTHLYQRLANGGWGHARVSLLYAGMALVALPIAELPDDSQGLAIAAYFLGGLVLGLALDRRTEQIGS